MRAFLSIPSLELPIIKSYARFTISNTITFFCFGSKAEYLRSFQVTPGCDVIFLALIKLNYTLLIRTIKCTNFISFAYN